VLHIRGAEPEDAAAVAVVHVRSWQVAYRGLLPDDYLDHLRPEERAARYTFGSDDPALPRTLVATEDGVMLGFATTGPSPDDDTGSCGQLFGLYVDPGTWNRGIGRSLVAAARAQLVDSGFPEAVLWVMAGNARAERFYVIDGWTEDNYRRTESVWGIDVDELRYRRRLA
jgi:ribosomal protein S18 acetylase RimI-like enzyme